MNYYYIVPFPFLVMALVFWWDWRKEANSKWTFKSTIIDQMNEPRPLPMGQQEFVEWSDRIISGALIPTEDRESLVAILGAMILELGQTEDHKPDAFFIHKLRKAAANEVAHANFQAIKNKRSKAAEEKKIPEVVNITS